MKSSEILLQFALWNCRFREIGSILLGFTQIMFYYLLTCVIELFSLPWSSNSKYWMVTNLLIKFSFRFSRGFSFLMSLLCDESRMDESFRSKLIKEVFDALHRSLASLILKFVIEIILMLIFVALVSLRWIRWVVLVLLGPLTVSNLLIISSCCSSPCSTRWQGSYPESKKQRDDSSYKI